MNYLVFQILSIYLDKNNFIFYSLVCKEWNKIIKIIKKDSNYQTPYSVLISKSVLQYAEEYLNLKYCHIVKHAIIKNNDLKTIQYLNEKTNILNWYGSYKYANLDTMKWLKENGCEFGYDTFRWIAHAGNLDTMKWLKENGCEFRPYTFSSAASNGNLDNMKWLKENGCEFDRKTFKSAASNGNLDNMKWLKENGCEFDFLTFNRAARNGNLDNMKWLKENGCKFGDLTAAGNLDTMRWLKENGYEPI